MVRNKTRKKEMETLIDIPCLRCDGRAAPRQTKLFFPPDDDVVSCEALVCDKCREIFMTEVQMNDLRKILKERYVDNNERTFK